MSKYQEIANIDDEIDTLFHAINQLERSYFTSYNVRAKTSRLDLGGEVWTSEVIGDVVGEVLLDALKQKMKQLKKKRQSMLSPWRTRIFGGEETK